MPADIEITSPQNDDTVPDTFCVTGTITAPASTEGTGLWVRCVISYPGGGDFSHGRQEIQSVTTPWKYQFVNATTGDGELRAILEDSTETELASHGPVDITISDSLPADNCS